MKRLRGLSPPPAPAAPEPVGRARPGAAAAAGLLLAAGFLLRFFFLLQFRETPYYQAHLMDGHDQRTWVELAVLITRRPWFVDGAPFYQAPGYAYFLAAVFRLCGLRNYLAVGLVQGALDTLTGGLVMLIGRRLWNRRVALAAGFVYLFYRPFVIYAATPLSDSFILFSHVLVLFLFLRAADEPQCRRRWFLAGLGLGLATLAKPTILLFAGPALLAFLRPAGRPRVAVPAAAERPAPFSGVLLPGLAGLLLPLLPVVLRNSLLAGRLVGLATYGPINWIIGNSADSIGLFMYPEGELLSPLTADFWRLWGRKTLFFLNAYEWPQNINLYLLSFITGLRRLPLFSFGLVVPAGLAGMFCPGGRRRLFLNLYILAGIVSVIAFFVTSRYRLPAVAGLILSACGGLDCLWRAVRSPGRATAAPAAGFCLGGLLLSFTLVNSWSGPLVSDVYAANYAIMTRRAAEYYRAADAPERAASLEQQLDDFRRRWQAGEIW